ncbi:MAG: ATP-dependent Clp protease ATP-binding subunit, partial [Clostridia bacterium]|nr:ATP-dependent Clp protease ATP-binding subunit [Clostridia bacterium]
MNYDFSKETQSVVDYATKLAYYTGGLIKPEHILVALLALDKPVAEKMAARGVTKEYVLRFIEKKTYLFSSIGISESGAEVLKTAKHVAMQLASPVIEPIHLMIAILLVDSRARNIVISRQIDPETLAKEFSDELSSELDRDTDEPDEEEEDENGGNDPFNLESLFKNLYNKAAQEERRDPERKKKGGQGGKLEEALEELGEDLTDKAKKSKLDPVIGRKNEIERIIQILSRRTKNNPVLIGEPGVGK